jgi:hypothetical protein
VKFVAIKKRMSTNFVSLLSFVSVFGFGIRDPRSGIQDPGWVKIRIWDPGSGINIPDPQRWNSKKIISKNKEKMSDSKKITCEAKQHIR